ncbi:wax ester/triacylglycerol synthase family O-acyltransferase [Aquabacterium sp.]|uniref:wax ester/triacylglycerol synthase family O-acyltransferase n=1 Tax=Aquabacterium sp. TaxID=1872578 RepID=UPI002CD9C848|nr:wax ester/triacylglycerol synthase family O-acyltransferase [Aquabacterium sp.]HSW09187.1 wax ester/triacylglycerol synthase family O-acyltransferase [Aquabacterium sp.]
MKQLSGLDAAFLYLESAEMPMHVGALNIYELPAGHKGSYVTQLRKHVAERLPLIPVLRRRLWWMPLNLANPAWVDAEPDLGKHIVSVKLPKSAKYGDGLTELEALVSELHARLLDRKRPLWKLFVLEGLAPTASGHKRVGLYSQFHHAAVDGQAAVALAQVLLDLTPVPRQIEVKPNKRSKTLRLSTGQMLRGALASEVLQVTSIIKQLPSTLGTLAGAAGVALSNSSLLRGAGKGSSNVTLAPRTVLNQSVTAQRAFAGVTLPLGELKTIAKANEATLNDVVLLLCGTALRRYFAKRDALPRKSLIAAVPVSLREKGDTTSDTQASMSLVSLGTHIADFRKRFAHVKEATAAMKATMGKLKSVLPTDYPSIGVPWLVEAAAALYGKAKVAERIPQLANVAISNVPGPPVPLYLAGGRMMVNYPTSIVTHGLGLNITVESYDKQMDFGLVADAAAMPDVRELADGIALAFDDLRAMHAEDTAPPTVVDTGRAVLGQARRRLTDVVTDAVKGAVQQATGSGMRNTVGKAVGAAVGKAMGTAVGTAVGSAVKTAGTVARATGVARASAPMKARRAR